MERVRTWYINRIYGLSFHSSISESRKKIPEILLSVSFAAIANPDLCQRLRQLGQTDTAFTTCGSYHEEYETGHYRFTLSARHREKIAEVLSTLLRMLQSPLFDRCQRNGSSGFFQLLSVLMAPQWLGGYIYPTLRHWLTRTGIEAETNRAAHQHAGVLPIEVETAMRFTWQTIASKEWKKYSTDCKATICTEGRFLLSCFGNACDVAIYPDADDGAETDEVCSEYSCHNLDYSTQQLTLLAGLAALHAVADAKLHPP